MPRKSPYTQLGLPPPLSLTLYQPVTSVAVQIRLKLTTELNIPPEVLHRSRWSMQDSRGRHEQAGNGSKATSMTERKGSDSHRLVFFFRSTYVHFILN